MGRNDVDGDHLRNISRNDTGSDTGSTGFRQRSGIAVYYHAGDSIVLDGTDAGRKCIGTDRADDQRNPPVLRWLFPRIPEDHPALEQIAVNCIANVLGLGWAQLQQD